MSTPPTGLLGGTSIWPYADMRFHAGSIVSVAPGIRLGIVRVNADRTVDAKAFGGSGGTFWEQYVTLTGDAPVVVREHEIRLVEAQPDGEPRPWVRVLCS